MSSEQVTADRDRWFTLAFVNNAQYKPGTAISSTSLLMELDIRLAFRAGAWISVIALAAAAVEAQFRHVFRECDARPAIEMYGNDPDLTWLREMRNQVMHASAPGQPSMVWRVGGQDLAATHAALELEAKRAVEVMIRAIYPKSPP